MITFKSKTGSFMRKNQYREILKDIFVQRVSNNPSYSLRAFARDLDLSVSYLSEVLTSKKILKATYIDQIILKLNLDENSATIFKESCIFENQGKSSLKEISKEDFNDINDPLVFALLSTFFLEDFVNDIDWISEKLRISQEKCHQLINALVEKDILDIKDGQITRKSLNYIVKNFSNPEKLREFHQKCLFQIDQSLTNMPSEKIHLNHLSFAINPDKISTFREKTDKYLDEIEKLMETGPQKDLYSLAVYLTPY